MKTAAQHSRSSVSAEAAEREVSGASAPVASLHPPARTGVVPAAQTWPAKTTESEAVPPPTGMGFIESRSSNSVRQLQAEPPNIGVSIPPNRTGMPDSLKAGIESLSGLDLAEVRVHANSTQPARLNALAYAQGNEIHLAPGQERHLPHEAWHVVQQRQGRAPAQNRLGGVPINDDPALEREATVMGGRAALGAPARPAFDPIFNQSTRTSPGRETSSTDSSPAVIQRRELTAEEILSALEEIPFVQAKLSERPNRPHAAKKDSPQAMRVEVEAVLGQYSKNLREGADATEASAMSIAVVLQAVGRIIALNELNDPALAPLLTVRLLELYRPEIEKKLKKLDHRDEALNLATAMSADDPVGLYLHNELRVEDAARRVRIMASLAGKTPAAMFELLRQRFEIEAATWKSEQIEKQEDTRSSFTVKEATGEVSKAYFDRLFGAGVDQPAWQSKTSGRGRWELGMSADTARRLAALETAVAAYGSGYTGGNRTWQRHGDATTQELTPKQSAHFAEIEHQEAALNRGALDARMIVKLGEIYKVDADEAAELLSQIKAGLQTLPLTLTVKSAGWFSGGAPKSTIYKPGSSRAQETELATLFNKPKASGSVKHLGKFNDTTGQGRGENYGRFRNWKDQTMSGNRGFSDSELPSFAAVNINWSAHSSQRLDTPYGVNSYGDTHFILRKANVLSRLVYTATDHGKPRRDIYLAFCDFVLGDDASLSQTGLKKTESRHVVNQVVNSLFTAKPVATPVQCFEVQIFGELDIAKDVEKIAVAPSVAADVQAKISQFCTAEGITFEVIAQPAEAVVDANFFLPSGDSSGASLIKQMQATLAGALLPTGY